MSESFKERKKWIRRIWKHHRQATYDQHDLMPTYFWDCLRATVALLLNRFDESILEYDQSSEEVAWKDNGTYETDYGTGESWLALSVQGFRVAIREDGSL